jgi:hypothetical protein
MNFSYCFIAPFSTRCCFFAPSHSLTSHDAVATFVSKVGDCFASLAIAPLWLTAVTGLLFTKDGLYIPLEEKEYD